MRGALEDTICAIATPMGEGGIGIVRISGVGALDVAGAIVRLRSKQPLSAVTSHSLHLADLFLPSLNERRNPSESPVPAKPVDEGLIVYMKAPRSFTGEDVVEIHSHGGALLLSLICEACVKAGARFAEPGEFSKRAFLNGRLDLSQAEAVLDTIRARSSAALTAAHRQFRGELAKEVSEARSSLLTVLAHVEAGIDFAEEDIVFLRQDELREAIERASEAIRRLESSYKQGRLLREGARVVIIGRPNVGKSSLLNRLLKEERAIVTPIPGTTRDVIEEAIDIDGIRIHLVDTAGIRPSEDAVELEGIKRSRREQEDADLQLIVLDGNQPLGAEDGDLLASAGEIRHIVVVNKSDLPGIRWEEELVAGRFLIRVSAKTGAGIEELRCAIRGRLIGGGPDTSEAAIVTNVRHRDALARAARSLDQALEGIEQHVAAELVCVDVRGAADALGEITGTITTEDILERIFTQFCIGK